jgi:hypothetical protein
MKKSKTAVNRYKPDHLVITKSHTKNNVCVKNHQRPISDSGKYLNFYFQDYANSFKILNVVLDQWVL